LDDGAKLVVSPSSPCSTKRTSAAQEADGTLIVGAGLAGLAMAAALINLAGVQRVHILERSSQIEWENPRRSAAVQLGPNGLRALQAIGGEDIVAEICKQGTCLEGNAILLPRKDGGGSDNVVVMPDTAKETTGLPQVLIRWSVLRKILVDLLPSGCVTTGIGREIAGYSIVERDGKCGVQPVTTREQCVLSSTTTTTQARQNSAPLLIAADGIHSTFQSLVHKKETLTSDTDKARRVNIKDNGRVNIKAVAPVDLGPDFRPGTTYSFFAPGGTIACFAGPAGKGYTYWAISIADETDAEGNTTRFASDVRDRSIVKERLLARLTNLEAPECHFAINLIEKTDADAIFVARSEERECIGPSVVSEDGLVLLVGDAAHAMSPAYGQAANFAFEDAATLATCVRDCNDLPSALDKYSSQRVARCNEMKRRSALRTAKAARGETPEDASNWIFDWTPEQQ
jgi:salicylate hydroxylase